MYDFDAARIKRIRITLGETQAKFAERLGVRVTMINRYERGGVSPRNGPVLKALLDAEREAGVA